MQFEWILHHVEFCDVIQTIPEPLSPRSMPERRTVLNQNHEIKQCLWIYLTSISDICHLWFFMILLLTVILSHRSVHSRSRSFLMVRVETKHVTYEVLSAHFLCFCTSLALPCHILVYLSEIPFTQFDRVFSGSDALYLQSLW